MVTNVVPYLYCCLAAPTLLRAAGLPIKQIRWMRGVSALALAYSMYAMYAAGLEAIRGAVIVLFIGYLLYRGTVARRPERVQYSLPGGNEYAGFIATQYYRYRKLKSAVSMRQRFFCQIHIQQVVLPSLPLNLWWKFYITIDFRKEKTIGLIYVICADINTYIKICKDIIRHP